MFPAYTQSVLELRLFDFLAVFGQSRAQFFRPLRPLLNPTKIFQQNSYAPQDS
jgi:hypothetical protein